MTQKRVKASDVIGNSYYIYTLQSSSNTPSLNSTINITCNVTDVYGQAISGKSITLYQNNTSKGAKTTDSSGNASWNSISMSSAGLQVFKVENSKIEVFVDNKSDVGHTHSQYLTEHQSLSNYVTTDDSRLSDSRTPTSHTHGNLQNNGQVGSTAQANKNVVTNSSGLITTEDKPTIPSASTSTPSADTTSGSYGSGTTYARANHTHPKSSIYAESSHTHTDKEDAIELITGTTTSSGNVLGGTSTKLNSLQNGTKILYKTPAQSSTDGNTAYLQLTLVGGTTSNNYLCDATGGFLMTKEIPANTVLLLVYVTSLQSRWQIISRSNDATTNSSGLMSKTDKSKLDGLSNFSGSYNDLTDKPTIPSASTSTPSADTTSGSVGTGTTWARSNHTHPKSSLYAESSHNHTKSQITDFPSIPSKTSDLQNDSGFLTSHQDISGKIDTAGTGLSKSGTTLNHSNSVTALTTASFKKVKYDSQGHITGTSDVSASDLPSHNHTKSQITDFPQLGDLAYLDDINGNITEDNIADYVGAVALTNSYYDLDNKPTASDIIISNDLDNVGTGANSSQEAVNGDIDWCIGDLYNRTTPVTVNSLDSGFTTSTMQTVNIHHPTGSNNLMQYNFNQSVNEDIGDLWSAIQNQESQTNKVTTLSSSSTDTQYPSAKCVYDNVKSKLDKEEDNFITVTNVNIWNSSDYHTKNRWSSEGLSGGGITSTTLASGSQGDGYYVYNFPSNVTEISMEISSSSSNCLIVLDTGRQISIPTSPTTFTATSDDGFNISIPNANVTVTYSIQSITFNMNTWIDKIYPIGAIYISMVNVNPSTLFSGEWTALEGRFLIGQDGTNYWNGATGGSATVSLTKAQMPRHNHTQAQHRHAEHGNWSTGSGSSSGYMYSSSRAVSTQYTDYATPTINHTGGTGSTNADANGSPHENMPPYIGVYMWKRIG